MYICLCVFLHVYKGSLGAQCEREELPQYAGLCYLAVSRCESSLNNPSGEAWALVKAGRQFLRAHAKAESGGLISPGGEQLEVIETYNFCLGG